MSTELPPKESKLRLRPIEAIGEADADAHGWVLLRNYRYEADGAAFHETNCHCSICRRTTGAPLVTWFSLRSSNFRLIKGEQTRFNSTERGVRSFCPRCGTQLTFEHADFPDEIDVTTGCLDDPELVPPRGNTHTGTRLRWVAADGLPEYRGARQQG